MIRKMKLDDSLLENISGGRPDVSVRDILDDPREPTWDVLYIADGKNNPGGNEDIFNPKLV